MKKEISTEKTETNGEQQPERREPSQVIFVLLLFLFLADTALVSMTAGSKAIVTLPFGAFPAATFAGVFSSMANICIIFVVVYFGKRGYYTSIALILIQFPIVLMSLIVRHNLGSLPGMFSNLLIIIAITLIYNRNVKITKYQQTEVENLKKRDELSRRLFKQTVTALVNAVDAKDRYSSGHSIRVAGYSEMIAREAGKDEEECRRIYYAGLLHDVGKIGIPNHIINKNSRLNDEEYETIKQHAEKGNQILSGINDYPHLCLGAHYHHERYDGNGYPDKLKGEEIPEIARIISVADAYDAMTSNRSYSSVAPQEKVREQIEKGAGTQFDPEFARIMLKLIDRDTEYKMRQQDA